MSTACLTSARNYNVWKTQVSQVLQYQGLWDTVSTPRPPDPESDYATGDGIDAHQDPVAAAAYANQEVWDERSLQAIEVIRMTVKPEIFDSIGQCNTARELWQQIGRMFGE
jgi:hypothetical protein